MKETIENLMKRMAEENDFEDENYLNHIGVAPEVTLTYLYGEWIADLYCEGQICYFAGNNNDEIYEIICKETNWDGDNFSGATAYDALQQMDMVCKKFRQYNCILTADIESD